ncbi:DUF5677 domain-containing protein [Paenibacillus kyungheensis]|uniref:DUF5677 domain-containing protein n=1 Tax=Paenibacillus kyungheensis TaxID=1452732 RepID=A0AAX3LWJ2_9BACL|nr:DUF5677 domain-containing protein [Paenibacillus kyungheensis]WCT53836.1 DUF5677 domain-containing protein [Paenibacillus kyungheensis]
MDEELIKKLDKIINKFVFESRKFVEYSSFPYGLLNDIKFQKKTIQLVYDFEYFVFTKSLKTLISIKNLLKEDLNEDVFILVRSIFENYLSCRYLHENDDKIDQFIEHPLRISLAHYNVQQDGSIVNRDKEIIGKQENPSKFKLGADKNYFYNFYDLLSTYAHCNFGIVGNYLDENFNYTVTKVNDSLLVRMIVVFVFSKLFELIVTVDGEDFKDVRTEKNSYQLVKDAIQLLESALDELKDYYNSSKNETNKYINKRMKELMKDMKKSLKEELGSVPKAEIKIT